MTTQPGSTPDPLDAFRGAKVVFGLRAQGHIPTIERMLAEGASWPEIGDAICWCPDTAPVRRRDRSPAVGHAHVCHPPANHAWQVVEFADTLDLPGREEHTIHRAAA